MRLPDITHGQEHVGSIRISPDIAEQAELANRIEQFLRSVGESAIKPVLRSRSFKDFRIAQPNGDRASLSAAYSAENGGRFSAEIHASHRPSGMESNYSLTADGTHWLRVDSARRGQSTGSYLDHNDMMHDMLEYSSRNGEVAALQDGAVSAQSIVVAVFREMARSAHHKLGSDHFKMVIPSIQADDFTSAKRIELIDARKNNRVKRKLSVTALTNIGAGAVDVEQSLVYSADFARAGGEVVEDGISLIHKSSDGISPQTLAKFAETSDVTTHPVDILHDALDELSLDTFIRGRAA